MGGGIHNPFFSKDKKVDCASLLIKTQLYSPDPAVISQLAPGDIMDVDLVSSRGPCIALFQGEVAGTIMAPEIIQLISCLSKGVKFFALVRRVNGGECAITVSTKN